MTDMAIIVLETNELIVEEGVNEILIQTIPDGSLPGTFIADHGSLTGLAEDDHPQYLLRTDVVITDAEVKTAYENNADTNYRTLIIELSKIDAPNGVTVLIREAIDRIEDMVDSARDIAGLLQLYAMSR